MPTPTPTPNPARCQVCDQPLPAALAGNVCPTCLMADVLAPMDSLSVDVSDQSTAEPDLKSTSTSSDRLAGTTLGPDGRYKILQHIGEGGFGTVYMANQTAPMRRRVAIKILKAGMDTRQVVARFEAERQALAMMDHPNIARIIDGGETEQGRPFFVMELVRGTPINTFCDREKLDTKTRLNLFLQVCRAVQHAHQKGIIHRDLKPGNILVTMPDGAEPIPKVIDFGVAKAMEFDLTNKTLFTRFEQMIGTPVYMSPEQAGTEGTHDVDTRADIYALGVLLYELLTGTTPFESETLQHAAFDEIRRILREEEAPRPSARLSSLELERRTSIANERATEFRTLNRQLKGDLDWIVMKAIEKDRQRRYDTANALAADVERHINNEPVSAGPPTAAYRTGKFLRRHKTTVGVAAAMVLLLVAGIVASSWQAVRANTEKRHATVEKQRALEAEALAEERRKEAEAISKFLTSMFESTKPGEQDGGRTITVEDSLKIAENKLEEDKEIPAERRAILQKSIAGVYYSLGQYEDAIALQESVLRFYDETHGSQQLDTLGAMYDLAKSYTRVSRTDEAVAILEEVISQRHEILGPEHSETLSARNVLANCFENVGRTDEALMMREEVLALRRKVNGLEYPDTIGAMGNLANSYADAGRSDEALQLREEVLALSRKVNGSEHPGTLTAMVNLVPSYSTAGRSDEAMAMREEVLALRRKVLGSEHPNTLKVMHSLAASYAIAGRHEEAMAMGEDALALRRKILAPGHSDTMTSMSNLSLSYRDAGRVDEAVAMLEEFLTLRRKFSGPEHPNTLQAMLFLTDLYRDADRLDDAVELGESLLALNLKVRGKMHRDTLNAMTELAISFLSADRLAEAITLEEEALRLMRKNLTLNDPLTLESLGILARCYEKAGRSAEAIALRRELPVAPLDDWAPAVATVLVPPDSQWRWLHPVDGVDPAVADPDFHRTFFRVGYDDSAWQSGKDNDDPTGGFGYGDLGFAGVDIGVPKARRLGKSAYFRHRFTTEKEFANLELRYHRDDGIIVFLDGEEVARDNMGEGEEAYRLPAHSPVGGLDETAVYRLPLGDLTLSAGEHVLAISLHNTEASSSDLRIGRITLAEVE